MVISEETHFDPKGYPSFIFCNIKMIIESTCLPAICLSIPASVEDIWGRSYSASNLLYALFSIHLIPNVYDVVITC